MACSKVEPYIKGQPHLHPCWTCYIDSTWEYLVQSYADDATLIFTSILLFSVDFKQLLIEPSKCVSLLYVSSKLLSDATEVQLSQL